MIKSWCSPRIAFSRIFYWFKYDADAEIVAQFSEPNFENDDDKIEDNVNKCIDVEAPLRPPDVLLENGLETLQNASL